MKKALYTMTAIAALSLSTLAASAQTGAHTDTYGGSNPRPQAILTISIGDIVLAVLSNLSLSLSL